MEKRQNKEKMENRSSGEGSRTQKLVTAGLLCALAVAGSVFSFPVFGSKCAPVQHIVNILCAVYLGPVYAVGVAFSASLLRNMMGLGTLMAFPGSMYGALLAGVMYRFFKKHYAAFFGEVFGTALLGGLTAYPVGVLFMGIPAGNVTFYAFVIPFFISTAGGAVICAVFMEAVKRAKAFYLFSHS